MRKLAVLLLCVAVISVAASVTADQLKPNDYCFALLGFEGDGGPVFIIADEQTFKKEGVLVGPPPAIVPAGFLANPESDVTFEYRGTIAAGRAALLDAGFKECPEIAP